MAADIVVDCVVVGAGMAGMTAAARVASAGHVVMVVEKADRIGGSAVLSGGFVWSLPSVEAMLTYDPEVDVRQAGILLAELPEALTWVAGLGIDLGPRRGPRLARKTGLGEGHQIDVDRYLRRCRAVVESRGSWVVPSATVERLARDGERVTGLTVTDRNGETVEVRSRWTILATGGFQADRDLVSQYIEVADPDAVVLRSNPASAGDGLRLATAAGAALTSRMGGFYGHLVASPVPDLSEADYVTLAQYHSDRGMLIDASGRRFTDERRGDHANAQAVAARPGGLAFLVVDDELRRRVEAEEGHDKVRTAEERGARVVVAPDLPALARGLARLGVPEDAVLASAAEYDDQVSAQDPALTHEQRSAPLATPPFAALQVQAAITFTYGGLATDARGKALRGDGTPVPGLLVAGVDIGGLHATGYSGGLARALVTGHRAAGVVEEDLSGVGAAR